MLISYSPELTNELHRAGGTALVLHRGTWEFPSSPPRTHFFPLVGFYPSAAKLRLRSCDYEAAGLNTHRSRSNSYVFSLKTPDGSRRGDLKVTLPTAKRRAPQPAAEKAPCGFQHKSRACLSPWLLRTLSANPSLMWI